MKSFFRFTILLFLVIAVANIHAQETPSDEDIIAAVTETTDSVVVESIISNDGLFSAEVLSFPCTLVDEAQLEYAVEFLYIQDVETSETIWQTQQVIGCGGLGTYGFDLIRWVDTYIYYSTSREGNVDGLALSWTPPLFRYDAASLANSSESLGFALLSPLDRYLVSWEGQTIIMGDANSSDNLSIDLENDTLAINNVLWLPDESGVLVIQADVSPQVQITQSLVIFVERETMTQSQLLDTSE